MQPAQPLASTDSPGRNPWLLATLGYFIAFISLGMATAVLGPTMPTLAERTGSTLAQISILFSARSLGFMLGALRGGLLYDRVAGHRLVPVALLILALALFMAPLLSWLWLLAAVIFLLGVSESMVDMGTNTLLLWAYGRQAPPYMNALHFFFGLGAFVSPIIVAQALLVTGDITWAYWLLALLVLPAAAWLPRWPSPTSRQDSGSVRRGDQINRRLVALLVLLFVLYVGAEVSVGGWVFAYSTIRGLASEATAAYLTSAFWGALTAGRLLSIPLAARSQPQTLLLVDLLGCLASVALILIWPASIAALWLGVLGLGFFMAAIFPTLLTFAERRMAISGRVTGWFFFGASVGAMILPWLVGQLFERIGPHVTFVIIGIDLIIALAVFLSLIFSAAARRPQADIP